MLLLPLRRGRRILLYDRPLATTNAGRTCRPARLAVLGLAFVGGLTHPLLDWMNTYGIRLLMPFSERWFYGDALFIIDPWIWLLLAAPVVGLAVSRRGRTAWVLLGIAATLLVMLAPQVPLAARGRLGGGDRGAGGAHGAMAWRRRRGTRQSRTEAANGAGLGAGRGRRRRCWRPWRSTSPEWWRPTGSARGETERAAAAAGFRCESLMVAPLPANPFAAELVVETRRRVPAGHAGLVRVAAGPLDADHPEGRAHSAVLATLQLQEVRDFLRWSRFPYVEQRAVRGRPRRPLRRCTLPTGMRGGLSGMVVHVEGLAAGAADAVISGGGQCRSRRCEAAAPAVGRRAQRWAASTPR
jgi:inner membrane protein